MFPGVSRDPHQWVVGQESNSLNVVHALHGSVGLGVLVESDKAKATASASIAILHDNLSSCE